MGEIFASIHYHVKILAVLLQPQILQKFLHRKFNYDYGIYILLLLTLVAFHEVWVAKSDHLLLMWRVQQ